MIEWTMILIVSIIGILTGFFDAVVGARALF